KASCSCDHRWRLLQHQECSRDPCYAYPKDGYSADVCQNRPSFHREPHDFRIWRGLGHRREYTARLSETQAREKYTTKRCCGLDAILFRARPFSLNSEEFVLGYIRMIWMAISCRWAGTKVEFTYWRQGNTLLLSSSGGGLFGRPTTRKSPGRFSFLDRFWLLSRISARDPYAALGLPRCCSRRPLAGRAT